MEELDTKRIYFRSDDEQRTLMSGQILIHSMFDLKHSEIIDWHTGDYIIDTLSPNSKVCPLLTQIENEITQSEVYKQKLESNKFKNLQNSLNQVLGSESNGEWSWNYLQDCLMTTLCSGRNSELPVGLTDQLINDAISHIEEMYANKCLYNNSKYSKLSMANTAYRIRTRIESVINSDPNSLKFVLYCKYFITNYLIILVFNYLINSF